MLFALFILACNDKKPKKTYKQEVTLQDIKQEEQPIEPPPPPPPKPDPVSPITLTDCFQNEGLKYSTKIILGFDDNRVGGIVISGEIGANKTDTAFFSGTKTGSGLNVEFDRKSKPPVVGDASEWTNKPWTLKKSKGTEVLQIVFNAKNYDTNKWEETVYEFEKTDCKK